MWPSPGSGNTLSRRSLMRRTYSSSLQLPSLGMTLKRMKPAILGRFKVCYPTHPFHTWLIDRKYYLLFSVPPSLFSLPIFHPNTQSPFYCSSSEIVNAIPLLIWLTVIFTLLILIFLFHFHLQVTHFINSFDLHLLKATHIYTLSSHSHSPLSLIKFISQKLLH